MASPLPQVLTALNNSNINVGGQTVNIGQQAAIVRGVGLIRSASDIGNVVLASNNGVSVMLHDVADVTIGHQPRLGIAGQDNDDDIVQGIVLMRRGEQSMPTIKGVEEEVRNINSSGILPPGVSIKPIYDRTDLINLTTHTVLENMLVGMVLIFLVQWLFLGDLRSAAIASATIPFALLFAVTILMLRGESANLLSVGAIDFGLVVDATVIMVENIFRHLSGEVSARGEREKRRAEAEASGLHGKLATILLAAQEVGQPILFSAAIIVAAFVPLFTMSGVEGHIFGPMARTYAFAIAGGVIATFTITPVLAGVPSAGKDGRDRNQGAALPAPALCLGLAICAGQPHPGIGRRGCAVRLCPSGHEPDGHGVPAASGRRQFLDSRHHAGHHLAGNGQRLCQPDAQGDRLLSRSDHRGVAERPP